MIPIWPMRHKKNSAEKLLGRDLLPSFCEGSHIGEELSSPPPSLPFKDVIRWFVAAAAILRPWGETLLTHYRWQRRKREPGSLNYCTKPCIYILPNFSQILSVHIVFKKTFICIFYYFQLKTSHLLLLREPYPPQTSELPPLPSEAFLLLKP